MCKNCLCQREEHDIKVDANQDAGVSVGKLLFSPTVDTLKKTGSGSLKLPPGVEFVPSPLYVLSGHIKGVESVVVRLFSFM